jgi:AbrB family transcriptional regulator (stage V sporulation protein T)
LPIITAGDISGAVAFLSTEKVTEASDMQRSLINAAAKFLSKQAE